MSTSLPYRESFPFAADLPGQVQNASRLASLLNTPIEMPLRPQGSIPGVRPNQELVLDTVALDLGISRNDGGAAHAGPLNLVAWLIVNGLKVAQITLVPSDFYTPTQQNFRGLESLPLSVGPLYALPTVLLSGIPNAGQVDQLYVQLKAANPVIESRLTLIGSIITY